MSRKYLFPVSLVGTLLAGASAGAQIPEPDPVPGGQPPPLISPGGPGLPPEPFPEPGAPMGPAPLTPPGAQGALPPGAVTSPWIADQGFGCCGPIGGHGPVSSELYLRTGPSLILGGGFIDDKVQPGWLVQGGGRTYLFNPSASAAWALDLGLSYTYNNGRADPTGFDLFGEQLVLNGLHRTDFRGTIGREWWLRGPGFQGYPGRGTNWRVGIDAGAFIGTSHADLTLVGFPPDYRRRYDVTVGSILGLNSTIEVPFGGWDWLLGLRAEWRFTELDLLPGYDGAFHDVNLLITSGIRF